jgi:hypothetical protein
MNCDINERSLDFTSVQFRKFSNDETKFAAPRLYRFQFRQPL